MAGKCRSTPCAANAISLRLSDEQMVKIRSAAARDGMLVSTWLRAVAVAKALKDSVAA